MSGRSRRKSFVDYRIQFALTRRVLFHWLLFWLASCIVSLIFKMIVNPSSGFMENLGIFWAEHGPFLVIAFLMFPIFALDTVKFSNRFAGPMVRLRKSMRSIAEGQPVTPIKFRPGDFWQDLAADFNRLLGRLKERGCVQAPDVGKRKRKATPDTEQILVTAK